MKKRPSSSSTQLQIWTPEKKREPPSRSRLDLAIVPLPQDSPTTFTLPEDWFVEERKRSNGTLRGNTDRYYHEPGTGRVFRSLVSVKRYLMETGDYEITSKGDLKLKAPPSDVRPLSIALPGYGSKPYAAPSPLKSQSLVKTSSSLKSANQILVYRKSYIPKHPVKIDRRKPLKLPKGWYVKRITRLSGHSMGRVDKYYCERATGRVFRSKLDVKRYLADNYIEENTTLSELFKPAGLIQISGSEEQDGGEDGDMAIVPHSGNNDFYSDISEDVPLKDLVRKHDDVHLKDLDVPLKDLDREADNVPLKDLMRKSDDDSLMDFDQNSDDFNMPLKNLVRKSLFSRKTSKHAKKLASLTKPSSSPTKSSLTTPASSTAVHTSSPTKRGSLTAIPTSSPTKPGSPAKNVFCCTTNTSPVNASKPPTKIKWVLSGPGGEEWSPFTGDTIVPESLKHEWAQLFIDIVSQKHSEASSSDALD
uniref:MBD domain-containing protein n=2 Tax=Kalanchoe fedtschenkoi TaxID=63787 RepID=A0A7N0UN07_KALFE